MKQSTTARENQRQRRGSQQARRFSLLRSRRAVSLLANALTLCLALLILVSCGRDQVCQLGDPPPSIAFDGVAVQTGDVLRLREWVDAIPADGPAFEKALEPIEHDELIQTVDCDEVAFTCNDFGLVESLLVEEIADYLPRLIVLERQDEVVQLDVTYTPNGEGTSCQELRSNFRGVATTVVE